MDSIQLTLQQFALIAPRVPPSEREEILRHLNHALVAYGTGKTIHRAAAFISNLCHESGQFKYKGEIWGPTAAQLRYEPKFDENGKMLPGKINAKARDLGNNRRGDGRRFKGWGWIQTTGRRNVERVFAKVGLPIDSEPSLLGTPRYAAAAAGIYWTDNNINRLADCLTGRDDANEAKTLAAICRAINGGYNGLDDRKRYYWRAVSVLRNSVASRLAARRLVEGIADNQNIPEVQGLQAAAAFVPNVAPVAENAPVAEVNATMELQTVSPQSEARVVEEQKKAAELIDMAEATPPSSVRNAAAHLGSRVVAVFSWFYALLQAGNWGAYAVVAVVAAGVVYFLWTQRPHFKRWSAIVRNHIGEWVTSPPPPSIEFPQNG